MESNMEDVKVNDIQEGDIPVWRIGLFTLNNCATNIAMFFVMQYSYFTQNVLGLAAAVIGIVATGTRIFDAVTDPLVGMLLDKSKGRHGKLRPFMLIGNVIIWVSLLLLFHVPASFSTGAKYVLTTALYLSYVIGYTCQTVCTKAGQPVLTNNPKKRPIFSGFDSVFTQLASALVPMLLTSVLAARNSVGAYADGMGLINPATWRQASWILAAVSVVFTILAMIGISVKDRQEFYERVQGQKVRLRARDYLEVLGHNRPIQMLIISAATDKLGQLLQGGVTMYIFANMLLNTDLQGVYSSLLVAPLIGISIGGVFLSRKFGLKRTFLVGTIASMVLLAIMFVIRPDPEVPYVFLTLLIVQKCIFSMGNSAVIPMIADCTDYENVRTGRFIPGMLGTMFSFVDKLISAFSTTIIGFALTMAGVGSIIITPNRPVNSGFDNAIMICFCVIPFIAHLITLVAMHWYVLDKKKMEEVQMMLAQREKGERQ